MRGVGRVEGVSKTEMHHPKQNRRRANPLPADNPAL